ncbi:hypothetical protein niasHT_023422 [Heterodera trifolii]|uniref:BACK domain-containing protein n=1 Tax=Heterodera trifolii TaxID=157864 RepID=A0ABD2K418_9BILA
MLDFIYTDDLSEVNGDNTLAVLYDAKKYDMPLLINRCLQIPIHELRDVFFAAEAFRLGALFLKLPHRYRPLGPLINGSGAVGQTTAVLPAAVLPAVAWPDVTIGTITRAYLLLRTVIPRYTSSTKLNHSTNDFAHRCWLYICRNAAQLVNSEAFLQIGQKSLSELFKRDRLEISDEFELWQAALRLADEKCRRNGKECSAVNRRVMLGSALFNIRFPLIQKFHCHPTFVTGQRSLLFSKFGRIGDWNVPKENGGTLAFEIENFSSVAAESSWRCWSHPTMLIKGLPWKTLAEISQDKGGEKWLGLYLQFAAENLRASWCCKCSKTLQILSHSNEDDYMKAYNHVFNNENICY